MTLRGKRSKKMKRNADRRFCLACDLEYVTTGASCPKCRGPLTNKEYGVPPEELKARRGRGTEQFIPEGTTKATGQDEGDDHGKS